MQTTRYPLWKSVLWVLGIMAYVLGVTGLSALWAWNLVLLGIPWDKVLPGVMPAWLGGKLASYYVYFCAAIGPWIGVLAVAAWQLTVHRHKTSGRVLTVMTGIAVVVSLYVVSWLTTGGWWLGLVGVPNPMPLRDTCHEWVGSGCASHFATQTAEAPHPPGWLPWGNPITLNLIDFGIHPELYRGRTVTTAGEILHIYSPTEFVIGSTYGGAYVVAPDPSYTKDIHWQDMVWLKGIAGGNCKAHYPDSHALICAEEIRDLSR